MAKVKFVGVDSRNAKIQQGDYVYCEAEEGSGANNFWGIYSEWLSTVIDLDGAGSAYITGKNIYLGQTYNRWKITRRIPCENAVVHIDENIK